jgi:hypothetical protein
MPALQGFTADTRRWRASPLQIGERDALNAYGLTATGAHFFSSSAIPQGNLLARVCLNDVGQPDPPALNYIPSPHLVYRSNLFYLPLSAGMAIATTPLKHSSV